MAAEGRTLLGLFEGQVARDGAGIAARQKHGGVWRDTTWAELGRRARAVSDGLAALGVAKGERVALIGDTALDWVVADMGIQGAGAIVVPIYQSNKPHECRYILEDSGATWVFADSEAQVAKLREVKDAVASVKGLIRFQGEPRDGWERTLAAVEKLGAEHAAKHPEAHAARVAAVRPEDPACIIYTSGTTGNPKGVILTQGCWAFVGDAGVELGLALPGDVALNFLPLAHSMAWNLKASWFATGGTAAFAESIEKLVQNAAEVQATLMPAVPRVFEKAYGAVVAGGMAAGGLKGMLFRTAMDEFDRWVQAREQGREHRSLSWSLARRLVFPKLARALQDRFGGKMRLFFSGGAPLSAKIGWFFELVGFTILEGYGLTETSGSGTMNRPGQTRIGTVGPPLPGVELRIAPDGEILMRGPNVMQGYWNNPAATAEVLAEGWFHTGDIGVVDPDGALRITDRKKDIIVTSGGKNVAPQNLENDLKTDLLLSQVMVHGDKRKYLSALVTLNEENAKAWAAENGLAGKSIPELAADGKMRARVQQSIDALNARQPSYATLKKFAILPHDLTIEAGELTPTLKVKRKFCSQKYADILDSFYDERG